jgi:hypothetical protein
MRVGLRVPDRVRSTRVFVTSHLLLIEPPIRQLDLVREQIAPSQSMSQPELGPQRPQTLHGRLVLPIRVLPIELYEEVIVRVTFETFEPVSRHLVLVIDFGHGRSDVVRVELLVRHDVVEPDLHPVRDYRRWSLGLVIRDGFLGHCIVEDVPIVVLVLVRVEGDLLL